MRFNSYKTLIASLLLLAMAIPKTAVSQTPNDAIMMEKGQLCVAAVYGHDSWDEYWEGTRKRSNGNIGTFTRQSVMGMFSLGITDKINLLGGLPWMKTDPSAGQMKGAKGLQDWGVWIKANALDLEMGKASLGFYPVVGLTGPASNYAVDYLPFALGFGAYELMGRAVVILEHEKGFYLRGSYGYHLRSNTEIERDYYYLPNSGSVYSNTVDMPNATTFAATLGAMLLNNNLKVEATYDGMNTLGGADIRLHDMPFPSNNMDMTRAGLNLQYYIPLGNGHIISVIAGGSQVFTGRNVGQSTSFVGGLTYQFGVFGKKEAKN
jgi:hypothetical protein